MRNKTKAIIAGVVVGAAVAAVATVCYIKKHVVIAKVHLFDTANQEGWAEQIEEMLPTDQNPSNTAPRPHCKKWEAMCQSAQEFLKENKVN